jgi:hypothetical protein
MSLKKAPATTNLHGIDAEMARVVPASATAILLFAEMLNVDQAESLLDLSVIFEDGADLRSWAPEEDQLGEMIESLFFDEYENDETIRFVSIFVKGSEVSLFFGYDRNLAAGELSTDREEAAILHHFGRPWVTPPMEVEDNPQQVVVHNDWDWDDEPE